MVHEHLPDPISEYISKPSEDYFSKIEGRIFISEHTNIQVLKQFKNKIYCNPESVRQTRDNNQKTAFAIVGNNNIKILRTACDMEKYFS